MSGNPTHGNPEGEPGLGARRPSVWCTYPKGPSVSRHAMANGRCRMHGGASPGAPRGEGNGMWRHGLRSIETIERRREMTAQMRRIRREISAGLR